MGQGALPVNEDDPSDMYETVHTCTDGDCAEPLLVKEVVMLLQVVVPQADETQQVTYAPFEGPDYGFAYEPHFFHDGCWANIADGLSNALEEFECAPEVDPYSFGTCSACGNGLRVNEPIALMQMGEFEVSPRQPDDEHNQTFTPYQQEPERFCLSCTRTINTDLIEMWPHISFAGECAGCTYERNWRTGVACTHAEPYDND